MRTLAELEAVSRRALAEIRSTVGGLRTAELSDELGAARVVLADAGITLTVNGDVTRVPLQHRALLGWVVREAITNIIRHAQASQCRIDVGCSSETAGEQVLLRIVDNGVGLGMSTPGNGLGGLQERADAAGAALRIRSDRGTEIEVVVPAKQLSG